MTETIEHERTAPKIPDQLYEEARDLIRDLASSAGDAAATYAHLQEYCKPQTKDDAFAGFAAALLVMFTECITNPTDPGEFAEVSLPSN
ncbi:hypothetical protein GCM10009641_69890 [Mycobacterium cookii]|uniref:Uncharacterized protein n=1 Tax=Nocardioides furvisabuli TaxID=375542 RepID=A0ABP5IBP9_9ACTN|nr:hypothetical protein [Nocardioides furvisabuli]